MNFCPFCEKCSEKFEGFGFNLEVLKKLKVVGGGYRGSVLCPECKSMDRERLVYLYLKKCTDLFEKKKKILHVAPEKRLRMKIEELDFKDYVTADLSKKHVDLNFSLENIPFEDEVFDVIICNHVLEHIQNDIKAMKELFRVMKKGSFAILQVPFSPILEKTYEDNTIVTEQEREEKFGQYDHVRIYALDYMDRLRSAGFKVEKFIWQDNDKFLDQDYGLAENEPIFVVKKIV